MTQVLVSANQKGGVTKTTSTANVGAALAERDKRVLLVDADPQADLSEAFGVREADARPAPEGPAEHPPAAPPTPIVAASAAPRCSPPPASWRRSPPSSPAKTAPSFACARSSTSTGRSSSSS